MQEFLSQFQTGDSHQKCRGLIQGIVSNPFTRVFTILECRMRQQDPQDPGFSSSPGKSRHRIAHGIESSRVLLFHKSGVKIGSLGLQMRQASEAAQQRAKPESPGGRFCNLPRPVTAQRRSGQVYS